MELYSKVPRKRASIVTLGVFDGVHLGHRALIERTVKIAKSENVESGAITFTPYPEEVLFGVKRMALTLPDERENLIKGLGVDFIVNLEFTKELSTLEPEDFARMLSPLNPKCFVLGEDFAFGKSRRGSSDTLTETFGNEVRVEVVRMVENSGVKVKSTTIRELLGKGAIEKANKLLGRKYALYGTIIKGRGKGRGIGIPTANIAVDKRKFLPAAGVYSGAAAIRGRNYPAGIFVSVGTELEWQVEVHLLGFDGNDIYGERLDVEFEKFLRAPVSFDTDSDLVAQIRCDLEKIRR